MLKRALLFLALLCAVGPVFAAGDMLPLTGAGGKITVSSGGRTCTDGTNAAAFLARTSGLSNAAQDAYCVLINGLDTDGLFAVTDQLLVFAAPDSTTALLNLITGSVGNPATVSGAPTFTANAGYAKSGSTSLINTQFNASTSGTNYTVTRAGAFVFTLDSWGSGVDSGSAFGMATDTNLVARIYPHFTDNNTYIDPQTATGQGQAYPAGSHFIGYGTFSAAGGGTNFYFNSSSVAKSYLGITALVNDNFALMNDYGGAGAVYNGTIAAAWIGDFLSPTQAANLYSRLCTYLTTVHGSC